MNINIRFNNTPAHVKGGNLTIGNLKIGTVATDDGDGVLIGTNFEKDGRVVPVRLTSPYAFLEKTSDTQAHVVFKCGEDVEVWSGDVSDFGELFARRSSFRVIVHSFDVITVIRYANLHQHTEYSLTDGVTRIPALAKKTEYDCAITDHGNMHGFNEFYNALKQEGKHPIIGCEVYLETTSETPRKLCSTEGITIYDSVFADEKEREKKKKNRSKNVAASTLDSEHLILLAKDETGLKNLFWLTTESSNHIYKRPHVTIEMLKTHHEGLVATSACIASGTGKSLKQIIMAEHVMANKSATSEQVEEAMIVKADNERILDNYLRVMTGMFGDDFYIELQNHKFALEDEIMNRLVKIARQRNIKMTMGIDAHYLDEDDSEIHEIWLCQQTKSKLSDEDRMRFSGTGYWVHTSDEAVALFKNIPEALDNSLEIAEKCTLELVESGYHLPKYPLPEGFATERDYLHYLINKGYAEHKQDGILEGANKDPQKYIDRIRTEMKVIENMGWEAYFLVVSDFIRYANDTKVSEHVEDYFPSNHFKHEDIPQGILKSDIVYTGSGRGSAAGSLICACLGITKVDPIKYDLLFERFLNPDRVSMPDIDTDFEDAGREKIIDYCRVKYGSDQVSRIVTFGTAAARSSIKDVARILGVDVPTAAKLSSLVPGDPKITIKKALEEAPDFKLEYDRNSTAREIINYAMQIEGLKKNKSAHACGVLIADQPVQNYMPKVKVSNPMAKNEMMWVTQLQGPECETMGLLKMDFLGLRTLGVAHECHDRILKNHGVDIDYDEIPLYDVDTYSFLADGHTEAVFQAESDFFTKTLIGALADLKFRKAKAKGNEDALRKIGEEMFLRVSDVNALVRPGPMQYIDKYNENVLDPSKITYDDPSMIDQLSKTSGIMLYQEQVMILVQQMAGFSAGQSDLIRKGMAKKKKKILDEYHQYFVHGSKEKNIKGCVANGISAEIAEKVWADMEQFGSYGFNKSHAIAYSMHTVRTAWLALHYPAEYMCATINSFVGKSDSLDTIGEYITVCKNKGLAVLAPNINTSEEKFSCTAHAISFGLAGLKGVGKTAEAILEERSKGGLFTTYSDFLVRMSAYPAFNKGALESLIKSGALDCFDDSTRLEKIMGLEDAIKYTRKLKTKKVTGQFSLFDDTEFLTPFNVPSVGEYDYVDRCMKEKEVAGFYISGHPAEKNRNKFADLMTCRDASYIKSNRRRYVDLIGVVLSASAKVTKTGKRFWKFVLEDETGAINAVCFEDDSGNANARSVIVDNRLVHIHGYVKTDDYGTTLSSTMIEDISDFEKTGRLAENAKVLD